MNEPLRLSTPLPSQYGTAPQSQFAKAPRTLSRAAKKRESHHQLWGDDGDLLEISPDPLPDAECRIARDDAMDGAFFTPCIDGDDLTPTLEVRLLSFASCRRWEGA